FYPAARTGGVKLLLHSLHTGVVMAVTSLAQLRFDNRLVQQMPADPIAENYPRQVTGAGYSLVNPTPTRAPRLIAWAQEVADLLDLPAALCRSDEFVQVFSGNALLPGMQPYASCYGGHQF